MVDVDKGWSLYVSNGALAKSVEAATLAAPAPSCAPGEVDDGPMRPDETATEYALRLCLNSPVPSGAPKETGQPSADLVRGIEAIIGDLGSVDADGYYTGCVHRSDVEHVERLIAALSPQGLDAKEGGE
jgi:hypothetical protein